jgi:hypothetical protein
MAESFEAVAWARKEGALGEFEQKWLTVTSRDTGEAIAAFRRLGFETRGISILNASEARQAAERI